MDSPRSCFKLCNSSHNFGKGVLNEIIELQYLGGKQIVMFKCDWWDIDNFGKGVKIDKYGFVSVNTTRKLNIDEPFVLASQVEQVYYVKDGLNPNWLIALKGSTIIDDDNVESETEFDNDTDDDDSDIDEDLML
ncbi:hypothetical protein SLE2022_138390 [Rubroshorea leprosula]